MITDARRKAYPTLPWKAAGAAAAALFLARIAYILWLTPYGLGPDEAQYWHWTTHLDWSYLTKPPLTTGLIALSTAVFGDTLLGVKLFALFGQSVVALLGFAIAGLLLGAGAAWLAFALLATVPLVAGGGLLMSPDAVLLPLWMGALLVLLHQRQDTLRWGPWLAIGVLIGLGGLAKYTAGLFYPLLLLFMLLEKRAWLKQPQMYVAGLISLAMQAPVLLWNMQNGWLGLEHLLWQADGGGDTRHGGLATMGDFLLGQALVLGPLTFGLLLWVWGAGTAFYRHMDAGRRLLIAFTLPIFAAFLLQTLNAKVQLNWPLLGTVPALVLIPVAICGYWHRLRPILLAGIVLNIILSLALYDTFSLRKLGAPLPLKADPTREMMGWPQMGRVVGLLMGGLSSDSLILSTRYQTAAQVAFHTPGNPTVLYLNPGSRRANQYDLWEWPAVGSRLVLYVNEQDTLPPAVQQRFSQCEPWKRIDVEEGGLKVRYLATWLCWNSALALR